MESSGVVLSCGEGLGLSEGSKGMKREVEVGSGECASVANSLGCAECRTARAFFASKNLAE